MSEKSKVHPNIYTNLSITNKGSLNDSIDGTKKVQWTIQLEDISCKEHIITLKMLNLYYFYGFLDNILNGGNVMQLRQLWYMSSSQVKRSNFHSNLTTK